MPTDPWATTLRRNPARQTSRGARSLGTAVSVLACATLASMVVGVPGAAGASAHQDGTGAGGATSVDVLVEGEPGGLEQVVAAVEAAGGVVEAELAVLDGVRATVPAAARRGLQAAPGVHDVTDDSSLVPLGARWGDDTSGEGRRALGNGIWLARQDRGSLFSVAEQVGADDVWRLPDPADPRRTLTGAGVGVALVDTGVAPVEGLLAPGGLVRGPDLSFDSQSDGTRSTDGMGHGTHMAGIIAGRDGARRPGKEHDPRQFTGIAPDARVVDVKVGAGDGGVDVSQVVAAIDWVVTNRGAPRCARHQPVLRHRLQPALPARPARPRRRERLARGDRRRRRRGQRRRGRRRPAHHACRRPLRHRRRLHRPPGQQRRGALARG